MNNRIQLFYLYIRRGIADFMNSVTPLPNTRFRQYPWQPISRIRQTFFINSMQSEVLCEIREFNVTYIGKFKY
jgi:hypothetical protein